MATIEHSEIVNASPERVFELLRRIEDFADYSDMIRSIDSLGENRYRWHVRAVGMDWSFDVMVTEIQPPHVLAWESLEGVKNQGRYRLREVPEGTEVALTLSYEIGNRFMEKAVNKAAKPLVGKVSRQILERVEARLNANAPR
ncbi:SRPBCC family protein [Vreelandella sulfidaeris]|uniref:SRPBCC family protein n=1 Tax=Vreelandella sulfidaeris TaxID=115553 RepID=UPI0035EEBFFE